jgi:hypothetical protein
LMLTEDKLISQPRIDAELPRHFHIKLAPCESVAAQGC